MTYMLIDDTGERIHTCAGFQRMRLAIWLKAADGAVIIMLDDSRAF